MDTSQLVEEDAVVFKSANTVGDDYKEATVGDNFKLAGRSVRFDDEVGGRNGPGSENVSANNPIVVIVVDITTQRWRIGTV
jgi:hypothetical protein